MFASEITYVVVDTVTKQEILSYTFLKDWTE